MNNNYIQKSQINFEDKVFFILTVFPIFYYCVAAFWGNNDLIRDISRQYCSFYIFGISSYWFICCLKSIKNKWLHYFCNLLTSRFFLLASSLTLLAFFNKKLDEAGVYFYMDIVFFIYSLVFISLGIFRIYKPMEYSEQELNINQPRETHKNLEIKGQQTQEQQRLEEKDKLLCNENLLKTVAVLATELAKHKPNLQRTNKVNISALSRLLTSSEINGLFKNPIAQETYRNSLKNLNLRIDDQGE
ncbi:hypothetical protein [Volucribacter amazonae]|uniref:Uncharacterized protein n=1 Tax=Volucribacter amazonae TaxID=256731 RepID=A0A9X4PBE9_9PAST|nr:hypothetical protein [Volucribacter amazonae]MDG6894139.1 hypothetical protein [Volucribacter amazonae]